VFDKNAKGFATKNAQFRILKTFQSSIDVQLTTATPGNVINLAALIALTLILVLNMYWKLKRQKPTNCLSQILRVSESNSGREKESRQCHKEFRLVR
jgi:hypothetical protein